MSEKPIIGAESFEHKFLDTRTQLQSIPFFALDNELKKHRSEMCGENNNAQNSELIIRTADQKNFRIYIHEGIWFGPQYINKLLYFLSGRSEGETVTFVLGTQVPDYFAHAIGALRSAIRTCKADTVGDCAGYCSIVETMLWMDCKYHVVSRYGALTFGITDMVTTIPAYKNYFESYLNDAEKEGILLPEEKQAILENGIEIMVLYSDAKRRTNARRAGATAPSLIDPPMSATDPTETSVPQENESEPQETDTPEPQPENTEEVTEADTEESATEETQSSESDETPTLEWKLTDEDTEVPSTDTEEDTDVPSTDIENVDEPEPTVTENTSPESLQEEEATSETSDDIHGIQELVTLRW